MKKLFFLCVVVIVYFSLYPWIFVPLHEHSPILQGFRPLSGKGDYLDIVVNFCFYLPLGVLSVLGWWKERGTPARWMALAVIGAVLSSMLETIQGWVPGRDSTLLDVLTNTLGTIAGARLGITIAGNLPTGLRLALPSHRRPMPAVLIATWLVSQWFPFMPILRISQFSESLHELTQVSSLGWAAPLDTFVGALLIGRLLREVLAGPGYRVVLAGLGLVLPVRLFLVVGAVPWLLVLAFAVGLLISHLALARLHTETRLLAAAAVLLIAVRELVPFHYVAIAEPFYWIPFSGFLEDTRDSAIRAASGKFFLYGAAVWMIRESGASLKIAAGGISGLLIAGEYAQRYIPGRVAASTDPVLAVIAACVMAWLKDRPTAPARSLIGHAGKHDRHDNLRV